LPGVPCVYNGDEVGAEFEPYAQAKPVFTWEDSNNLLPHYKKLISLRHSLNALSAPNWELLEVAPSVLGYLRFAAQEEENVLVLLNFGATPVTAKVPSRRLEAALRRGNLTDYLTGEPLSAQLGSTLSIEVPARGSRIVGLAR
jgi:cyclomaltodextrinase